MTPTKRPGWLDGGGAADPWPGLEFPSTRRVTVPAHRVVPALGRQLRAAIEKADAFAKAAMSASQETEFKLSVAIDPADEAEVLELVHDWLLQMRSVPRGSICEYRVLKGGGEVEVFLTLRRQR